MDSVNKFLQLHNSRVVGLDFLRCIAIFVVMYEHGRILIPKQQQKEYSEAFFLIIDGVSIFFVLSGFLIGGILLRTINDRDFDLKELVNFWVRRWFRTVPNYLLVLLVLLMIRLIIEGNIGSFNLSYFFFSQNLFHTHPVFFPEAWSLMVEEWFYLLFPLFCYGFIKLIKNTSISILIAACIFIIIPLILRIIKFESASSFESLDDEFRKIVIFRLDSIMYGIIAAYLFFKNPEFWNNYKFHLLIIGVLFCLTLKLYSNYYSNFIYYPLHFSIESIVTFCFLPFLSTIKTTRLKMVDAIIIFFSIISYSLYLLNLSFIQYITIPAMNKMLNRRHLPIEDVYISNYFAFWTLTILFSYLLYRFFENPVTKMRDRVKI